MDLESKQQHEVRLVEYLYEAACLSPRLCCLGMQFSVSDPVVVWSHPIVDGMSCRAGEIEIVELMRLSGCDVILRLCEAVYGDSDG
jgi:hypothetical protein